MWAALMKDTEITLIALNEAGDLYGSQEVVLGLNIELIKAIYGLNYYNYY